MKTKIKLDKKRDIAVDSSLNWLWIYRQQFGKDILPDLLPAIEAVWRIVGKTLEKAQGEVVTVGTALNALFDEDTTSEIFVSVYGFEVTTILQIIYCMAKNADATIPNSVEAWYSTFDDFPIDTAIPQALNIITKSTISSKNLKRLREIAKATR